METVRLSETLTAWAAGEECAKHEIAYCRSCKDSAGLRRDLDGTLRFGDDCAVQSFAELTGADYGEAVDAMRAVGYRPGYGTPTSGIKASLEAVGYTLTHRRELTREMAVALSRQGRTFLVLGRERRGGHAWTIVDGVEVRALGSRGYGGPGLRFRYYVIEVSA